MKNYNFSKSNNSQVQQKAEQLFLDFYYTVELEDMTHLDKDAAIECALITVNEIIAITRSSFWYRVREALNKM